MGQGRWNRNGNTPVSTTFHTGEYSSCWHTNECCFESGRKPYLAGQENLPDSPRRKSCIEDTELRYATIVKSLSHEVGSRTECYFPINRHWIASINWSQYVVRPCAILPISQMMSTTKQVGNQLHSRQTRLVENQLHSLQTSFIGLW